MQLVTILLLVGMLVGAGGCFYKISEIQRVYSELWGSDVATVAWSRKRLAFALIVAAQLLGVGAVLIKVTHWTITIAYFGLMVLAFVGFFDSYRILLADLKRLPRKR